MSKKNFNRVLLTVVLAYLALIFLGILLSIFTPKGFDVFRGLIPLFVAFPAAILAFYFQRRNSFLQQLRVFWSELVDGVQEAFQFIRLESPSDEDYAKTSKKLRYLIDDARAVWESVGENSTPSESKRGHYPPNSLEKILDILEEYHDRKMDYDPALDYLKHEWGNLQKYFLVEFDRLEPKYRDIKM